ncbi:MAG: hypothetical protein A2W31_04645 [Planctomycetes bacterium RBG_16_64_10]|nr:MAG: hypothetical protein A2W31_04645 [Planctomycetes bacterium RBG_16_64_10]
MIIDGVDIPLAPGMAISRMTRSSANGSPAGWCRRCPDGVCDDPPTRRADAPGSALACRLVDFVLVTVARSSSGRAHPVPGCARPAN